MSEYERERDAFREDTLREIELLELQRKLLTRAVERIDDERTALLELSVRLSLDTLPVADAPPIAVAICRAELARALLHVRRAGRFAVRIGLALDGLDRAREGIIATGRELPKRELSHREHYELQKFSTSHPPKGETREQNATRPDPDL